MKMSKRATIRKKQLEEEDPLVIKVAEESNLDLEYLEMLNNIENDTETQDLPLESEIRQMLRYRYRYRFRKRMSVVTLEGGTRLIVKDESEILIP